MKKLLGFVCGSLLLFTGSVYADTCGAALTGPAFTGAQAVKLCQAFGSAIKNSMIPNSDVTYDLGSSSKQWRNVYVGTSLRIGSGAQVSSPLPPVMTPNTSYPTPPATPNTGSVLVQPVSILATAAPTAAFVQLPQATIQPGSVPRALWNQSANPGAIVPISGDSINALAAGTPYACATTKICECLKAGNTLWACTSK